MCVLWLLKSIKRASIGTRALICRGLSIAWCDRSHSKMHWRTQKHIHAHRQSIYKNTLTQIQQTQSQKHKHPRVPLYVDLYILYKSVRVLYLVPVPRLRCFKSLTVLTRVSSSHSDFQCFHCLTKLQQMFLRFSKDVLGSLGGISEYRFLIHFTH